MRATIFGDQWSENFASFSARLIAVRLIESSRVTVAEGRRVGKGVVGSGQMPRRPLPLGAVTTLFLGRQHLARPRSRPFTAARLVRFVQDVGGLQMDSINVLERA